MTAENGNLEATPTENNAKEIEAEPELSVEKLSLEDKPEGDNEVEVDNSSSAKPVNPETMLNIEEIDEVTKQTWCNIPYNQAKFLVADPNEVKITKNSLRQAAWSQFGRGRNGFSLMLECEDQLTEVREFENSTNILIGLERSLQHVRTLSLKKEKNVYVPSARAVSGMMSKIVVPENASEENMKSCATHSKSNSEIVQASDDLKIDLIIVSCVVVTPNGQRLGRGNGLVDLEWAMMKSMGFIDADTVVIACVNDTQINSDEVPETLFSNTDVPVDIIVTPTQTTYIRNPLKKPEGIDWSKITEGKLARFPVLKVVKEKLEAAGTEVVLGSKISTISDVDENSNEKSCQTHRPFRRNNRFGFVRGFKKQNARARFDRKKQVGRRNRVSSTKSETESQKAADLTAKKQNRRNRQKSNQKRRQSSGNDEINEEGDAKPVQKSENGQDGRKKRSQKKNGQEVDTEEKGNGQRAGRRNGPGNRYPPPWLNPYGMMPPPHRMMYPPPPAGGFYYDGYRSNRYPYRNGPPAYNQFRRSNAAMQKPAVFVGDIPQECGEEMFQDMLMDRKVRPNRLIWQQEDNRSFLVFDNMKMAEDCLRKLRNLSINDEPLRVDLSNMTKRALHN